MTTEGKPVTPVLRRNEPVRPSQVENSVGVQVELAAFQVSDRPSMSSRNWAGAVAPAQLGRRFTCIAGRWKVPSLPAHQELGKVKPMVSIWIGLGGWQPWSKSMPHMGSEHGWDDTGKPVHRLWCQWWLGPDSDDGLLSWLLDGVSISPGDEIFCHLADMEDGTVQFYFFNDSTKELAGVIGTSTVAPVGSTAQWVVERPREVKASEQTMLEATLLGLPDPAAPRRLKPADLHPLPEIGMVTMRDCAALLGDDLRRTLKDAEQITLFGQKRHPFRSIRQLRSRIAGSEGPKLEVWRGDSQ